MLSTQSLREQLDRYAAGSISVEALEEWLAAESWDMRRWLPIGVQRLIEAIQSVFVQYSDGQISADQLNDHLLQRREQLHRSADTTKKAQALKAKEKEVVEQALRASVSENQALFIALQESALT